MERLKTIARGTVDVLKRLIATEPVRLIAAVEAVLALLVMGGGFIDAGQAAAIVAAIGATHELIRSIVYSPETAATLAVTEPSKAVAKYIDG